MIAFSYEPYSQDAVRAVRFACKREAKIVAVTDSVFSPAARDATVQVVIFNETPSILPSVVPAMAVSEILAAILVAKSGTRGLQEIDKSEEQLKSFNVYVPVR